MNISSKMSWILTLVSKSCSNLTNAIVVVISPMNGINQCPYIYESEIIFRIRVFFNNVYIYSHLFLWFHIYGEVFSKFEYSAVLCYVKENQMFKYNYLTIFYYFSFSRVLGLPVLLEDSIWRSPQQVDVSPKRFMTSFWSVKFAWKAIEILSV